ncbi:MAG TPA: alcohol dehydrogenase catalytic domain-containing protein [Candidatus Limiplasma sp.]|nr:alcohol dehydrogenase catalytic domain-containing protein [Candidatus Limiplasma sp.]
MSEPLMSRVGRVVAEGQTDFFTRPVPPPAVDAVVIRIQASALCGSDLHIFKAKHPSVPLPATIGHEFSGDIIAMGQEVRGLSIGQRVTVEPCVACGHCEACRHGDYGSCDELSFIYRKGDGAMADLITVKASSVFPLPDSLSYEAGALIEPLAVAVHAVRRADVRMGHKVLVLGAGAIGLLVAALCKRTGAAEVLVCDYSAFRLSMAQKLGATRTVNPREGDSLEAAVRAATDGLGADRIFECVGREETFVQALTLLRKKGLATVVGIFEQPQITIPVMQLVNKEICVQGSQGYCWDFPIALQLAGEIGLEQLVTHRFPLAELQQALETALDRTQNTVKVVLKP